LVILGTSDVEAALNDAMMGTAKTSSFSFKEYSMIAATIDVTLGD